MSINTWSLGWECERIQCRISIDVRVAPDRTPSLLPKTTLSLCGLHYTLPCNQYSPSSHSHQCKEHRKVTFTAHRVQTRRSNLKGSLCSNLPWLLQGICSHFHCTWLKYCFNSICTIDRQTSFCLNLLQECPSHFKQVILCWLLILSLILQSQSMYRAPFNQFH